jgi:hypothetical protein
VCHGTNGSLRDVDYIKPKSMDLFIQDFVSCICFNYKKDDKPNTNQSTIFNESDQRLGPGLRPVLWRGTEEGIDLTSA